MTKKKIPFLTRVAALLTAFFFLAPVSFAGGVGGYPANPLDSDNPGWFIYKLGPGESYEDVLIVSNTSDQKWRVTMYPADSISSSGGGFALKQRGEKMSEMGSWIKLSANEIVIEPGKEREVPFKITIPAGADVGEHAGAIMFEKSNPNTGDGDVVKEGGGVKISLRTGVRVYDTVPGKLIEKLELLNFSASKKKREAGAFYVFSSNARNKGNTSITVKYITTITNSITGAEVQKSKSEFLIARDSDFENNFEWTDLPFIGAFNVKLEAFAKLKSGTERSIGEREVSVMIVPVPELAIASLILIVIIGFLIYRRRKYSGAGWVEYIIKDGENLMSIAEQHGIAWETLAKVNKIRAPYFVNPGSSILVPPLTE